MHISVTAMATDDAVSALSVCNNFHSDVYIAFTQM